MTTFPKSPAKEMEFVWLERVEEAVAAALEPAKPADGCSGARASARRRVRACLENRQGGIELTKVSLSATICE